MEAAANPNKEKQTHSHSTSAIKLKLCHFELKLNQLNNLNSFIWENHGVLSASAHVLPELEANLLSYLSANLATIKETCFNNNEDLFNTYLAKRNFNPSLYGLKEKLCKSEPGLSNIFSIILHGCVLAHMFAPADPLDPFEYELLVKKCREDEEEIACHADALQDFNVKSRLKACQFRFEPVDRTQVHADEFCAQRSNQSDYFFIKNELDNALEQFCSPGRLGKLLEDLFSVYSSAGRARRAESLVEDEYKIWINSLERLTEKLFSTFYSYSDVVYVPLNGLALVGYGVKALYTSLK